MEVFRYGREEIEYLARRDPVLGAAIERLGMIRREVTPCLFTALIRHVVARQISAKAFQTVWSRLCLLLGEVTPARVAHAAPDAVQGCGLSHRKTGYILGIGRTVARRDLDLEALPGLGGSEVIERLTALPGVGVWTAEMLLIFSLMRPDVVSWGDLAIRRGMMRLYGLDKLTRIQFDEFARRYSPHGSVASLYLWKIAAP